MHTEIEEKHPCVIGHYNTARIIPQHPLPMNILSKFTQKFIHWTQLAKNMFKCRGYTLGLQNPHHTHPGHQQSSIYDHFQLSISPQNPECCCLPPEFHMLNFYPIPPGEERGCNYLFLPCIQRDFLLVL